MGLHNSCVSTALAGPFIYHQTPFLSPLPHKVLIPWMQSIELNIPPALLGVLQWA